MVAMLAPLLALVLSSPVGADPNSGTKLFQECQAHERISDQTSTSNMDYANAAHCVGYVEGFITGILVGPPPAPLCPVHATPGTIVRVYVAYMQQHPALLDKPMYEGLFAALSDAYPCPKAQ